MLGIPVQNFSGPHGINVEGPRFIGIEAGVHWHDGHAALVQHGHDHILDKGPASLINVGLHGQAVVQPGVNHFLKPALFIQTNMLNLD